MYLIFLPLPPTRSSQDCLLRETLKVISAAHSVGGKEQLAVGVSEDRALGLAEMCGRCLVGSAARGEGVCVFIIYLKNLTFKFCSKHHILCAKESDIQSRQKWSQEGEQKS